MDELKNQFFHALNDGVGFEERGDGNVAITIKVLPSDLGTRLNGACGHACSVWRRVL